MNSRQKIVLALAAVVIGAMILYPPWTEYFVTETGAVARHDHGYHFLWNMPEEVGGSGSRGVRIYSSRLSRVAMTVGIVGFILYVALGTARKKSSERE